MTERVVATADHSGELSDRDMQQYAHDLFYNIVGPSPVGGILIVEGDHTFIELVGQQSEIDSVLTAIENKSWVSGDANRLSEQSGVTQYLDEQFVSAACDVQYRNQNP